MRSRLAARKARSKFPCRLRQSDEKAWGKKALRLFTEAAMRSEVPVVVAGTVQVDGAISLQGSVRQLLVPGPEGGELITETGGRSGSHDEQLVPRAHHLLTSTRENCFYDRLGAHLWLIDRRYGLGVAGKHRLAPFELGRVHGREMDHGHRYVAPVVDQLRTGCLEKTATGELRSAVGGLEGDADESER